LRLKFVLGCLPAASVVRAQAQSHQPFSRGDISEILNQIKNLAVNNISISHVSKFVGTLFGMCHFSRLVSGPSVYSCSKLHNKELCPCSPYAYEEFCQQVCFVGLMPISGAFKSARPRRSPQLRCGALTIGIRLEPLRETDTCPWPDW
jgi:hypothetical protein